MSGRVRGAMAGSHAVRVEVQPVSAVSGRPVEGAPQKGEHAQTEADHKTDQIEALPAHDGLPSLLRRRGVGSDASGFKTWKRRSARFGVSRIPRISTRHRRESACFARASNAWLTCGSLRNLSAPWTSHRSSL